MLLKAGANVNLPNKKMNTPLSWAIFKGNKPIITMLKKKGAMVYLNINIKVIPSQADAGLMSQLKSTVVKGADLSKVNFTPQKDYHVSLNYVSVKMNYDSKYENNAKKLIKTIYGTCIKGREKTLESITLTFNKPKIVGKNKIAISYDTNPTVQSEIKGIYTCLFKTFQNTGVQKTYPVEIAPHMTLARIKKGQSVSPSTGAIPFDFDGNRVVISARIQVTGGTKEIMLYKDDQGTIKIRSQKL